MEDAAAAGNHPPAVIWLLAGEGIAHLSLTEGSDTGLDNHHIGVAIAIEIPDLLDRPGGCNSSSPDRRKSATYLQFA